MLFWLSLTFAAVPLIYDGPTSSQAAADAVALAVQETGLPESQFETISISSLLKEPPQTSGNAVIRYCAGETTKNSELLASAVRAETAWKEGDAQRAMDELDVGIGGLGCLGERVDAGMMGRMFLLRGGLLAKLGQGEDARGEFRSAVSVASISAWPEHFPVEGAPLFEEIINEKERVELTVFPTGIAAAPAVDGTTVLVGMPLAVRPGLHLLQVPGTAGLKSAWLTMNGSASLVVPGNYREPILSRLLDVPLQDEVELLLLTTTRSEAIYVCSQGSLFLITRDGLGTSTIPLVLAQPDVPATTSKRSKKDRK